MALSEKQKKWLNENCYPRPRENFKNVPEEWSTEEFWFEAVRRDGGVLEFVPDAQKTQAFMAKISLLRSAISSGSGGLGYGINLI
jgi:hypothetical protein